MLPTHPERLSVLRQSMFTLKNHFRGPFCIFLECITPLVQEIFYFSIVHDLLRHADRYTPKAAVRYLKQQSEKGNEIKLNYSVTTWGNGLIKFCRRLKVYAPWVGIISMSPAIMSSPQ